MIYSYLGQKDLENTLKVCTKIFKVKALIMIEEIAPPKITREENTWIEKKTKPEKKEKEQIINKINPYFDEGYPLSPPLQEK